MSRRPLRLPELRAGDVAIAWLVAALVGLASSVVTPREARPATWVRLAFTAPGDVPWTGQAVTGVARYRVEAWNGTSWDSARIYRAPGVEGVPVLEPGTPVELWVSQSTAPPGVARTYRALSYDGAGNRSATSNHVVVATGYPDTNLVLSRAALGKGPGWRRTGGAPVSWSLVPGDTAAVTAVHQESVQRAHRERLCRLFGRWALRGAWQSCP